MESSEFHAWMLDRGLSARTARQYEAVLRDLQRWADAHAPNGQLSAPLIAAYAASKPNTWSTQKAIRSTVRQLWQAQRRSTPAPVQLMRVPRRPEFTCRALEEADVEKYLGPARADARAGHNRGLAVLLGYYLGLRCFEIASLRWEAFGAGEVTIVGKGRKTATLPVHPTLSGILRGFPRTTSPYVFPGRFEGCVAHYTVRKWHYDFCDAWELPRVNPHKLRHTCLATMNDRTGDLRATQRFGRHSRPETTAGYTRATWSALLKVMNSLERKDDASSFGRPVVLAERSQDDHGCEVHQRDQDGQAAPPAVHAVLDRGDLVEGA